MSIRDRMAAQTANLRATAEIPAEEAKPADKPKTAPGMMAALSAAKLRIEELESKGASAELIVAAITPNPKQPRKIFNEAALEALAQSISEVGLLQPVVVRLNPHEPTQYQLVAGERRLRAHQRLGLEVIKAVVVEATDADLAVLALVENVSREDLTDYEVGKSLRSVEAEFPTRTRMAEAMGMSRSSLYRFFAYEKLPDFIIEDLDKQPGLLSGNATYALVGVLAKLGEPGIVAAKALWPQFLAGQVEQLKLPALIEALVVRRASSPLTAQRDSRKLYSGKEQVGSISKDARHFTVKIKSTALSEVHETQLRDLVTKFYKDIPV